MTTGWVALSRKANCGAHRVCPAPVGPASSPAGDLVFLSVYHTGHSSHPDRVLHVLYMLAQVGAPDGDTSTSVYRPSQWLHLFQDKDCSPPPTCRPLAAWRDRPSLPFLEPGPTAAHPPSKGGSEAGTRQRFNTPSR